MSKEGNFEVFLLLVAAKELEKLPKRVKNQIREVLKTLNKPFNVSSRKMKGEEDTYRIRSGDYRILYKIYSEERIVVIIKIAHRKQAYK